MTDDNTVGNTEPTEATVPTKPTTTVEGFISSLGGVVSNLRKQYRLTENGAIKVIQVALEYDLNRRSFPQQEVNVGEASGN